MNRRSLAAGIVLLTLGCGPDAGLWLRVEAPLVVPDDVDGLHIQVQRASGDSVFDHTYDLSNGPQFPLTLALTNADPANLATESLTVAATALQGGAQARPCAQASGSAQLQRGQITQLTLGMCQSP